MEAMFENTSRNNPNFNLNISNFDMGKVENADCMFNMMGSNSLILNFTLTINNPDMSYYSMFNDVAVNDGTQITVNYTSETSGLVDNMIANKGYGTNVVKGVQVD